MTEKKSKWWLFIVGDHDELHQIAVTDTKRALQEKINQKIKDDNVRVERLARFYGRFVPIETKQVYH